MTHNDYTAVKVRAPVAVYCCSVPKMKPGYVSLRNGGMESNLHLYGNRWAGADSASLQMKRSYLWGAEDGDVLTQIPSLDLEGRGDGGVLKNQRDEEVDSAALETSRLKDKLKRKMSESSRGAPSESLSCAPLKPAVPRSASQRLMTITKPVPPIQKSPTPGTPQENGPQNGETDITSDISEISLQYVRSSAERKRKSLGGGVIPPILKSSNFPADDNDGAQLSEDTPGSGSAATRRRSALEIESHRIPDADHTDSRHITAAEDVSALVPSKPILPTPSADSTLLPQLARDEEGKENHTRISLSISKSAQDKMRQKQQEIENIRNQKRRSHQQLWERLQGAEAAEEPMSVTSFTLSGLNTVPITAEKRRGGANMNLNKWVSRPSLPSIPTINPEPGISDFRHSSAFSLPASFLDLSDLDSDSEGGPGSGPMSHPEQGMIEALKWLNHKDWEQKEKGLLSIRCLASWHPDILCSRIHDVSMAVTKEVSNLRSKVSRHAIKTIGDLFRSLRRNMDQEVEEISRVLLHKIGDTNDFIREEADRSLGILVENSTPFKTLSALIAGGVSHRNSSVRKFAAKHLLRVVEILGADKLLCGSRESMDAVLLTLIRLVQDGQQDTRYYGRRMLSLVMNHPKFEVQMERLMSSHDLRNLITTMKQKELSDSVAEVPSARSQRPTQRNNNTGSAQDVLPPEKSRVGEEEAESQESPVPRRQPMRAAEMTEQLKELNKLLTAKEYQNKMDGVTLLLEYCKSNAKLVTAHITTIFDAFNPRMQDANKKVNQYALESAVVMIPILKDSLHHVLVPMVTVVTDNLNSKHSGIYTAAVTVMDTLIANIDKLWLLQPFASRIRFLSGRAMSDVTERLSGLVCSVYPRKPQAVERHVLPVLWFFLSNITGSGVLPGRNGNFKDVVTKLTKSLHRVMGRSLEEYANGQSQHALTMLADILGTNK